MKDALKIALHYLKFRPRSVFEIGQKLRSKKVATAEVQKVIEVLKKNQLLNDKNFAKMWVENRNLLKPEGSYLLKWALKKLGIAENIIEDTLKEQDEEALAKRAIESKSRLQKADFQKKAAFLQRRGFGTTIIYKILNPKS